MSANKYQKPWVEIIEFENEDIITASCIHGNSNGNCTGSNSQNKNANDWDAGDVRAVQGDEIW